MKILHKIFVTMTISLIAGIIVVSCSSSKEMYTNATDVEIVDTNDDEFKIEKSGAQLWGEVCSRCHLAPSPAAYNDTDWETISLHMRVRANLTEGEISKIKDFLKSSN